MAVEATKKACCNAGLDCDDETLFGHIEFMANNGDELAKNILSVAKERGWTVQRTAIVLAYTLMHNRS